MPELHPDRYFSPDPGTRRVARELYSGVKDLPLICPHGHVDPRIFADPNFRFSSPTELLIIPDHYIFRMLYSAGIPLEAVGIAPLDGTPAEQDHRKIWRLFAENYHLFRGTPTGAWLRDEFADVFGITETLSVANADAFYDAIAETIARPEFSPRALYDAFNVEVLCTTDAASDPLEHHKAIRASGWHGRILPTFRPDAVIHIDAPGWRENIRRLEEIAGVPINDYTKFIQALEERRAFFKAAGAAATDQAAPSAFTTRLSPAESGQIFQRALQGTASAQDAMQFSGHMIIEMARMSTEDGLVMQVHVGSHRNHNPDVFRRFGPDMGADIPTAVEFTRSFKPLLDAFGNHPALRLIVFNLDESTYTRELAPLAGHYPVLKLGPPWWFHDSIQGMERYFNRVMETAGIYNTVGFNDDTRAFLSIPARHDLWRRVACSWLAGLIVRHILSDGEATEMARALSYDLAREAYNLEKE